MERKKHKPHSEHNDDNYYRHAIRFLTKSTAFVILYENVSGHTELIIIRHTLMSYNNQRIAL